MQILPLENYIMFSNINEEGSRVESYHEDVGIVENMTRMRKTALMK